MAENIREFFVRRKRELTNRSLALTGELKAIEVELAEIAAAEAALPAAQTVALGMAQTIDEAVPIRPTVSLEGHIQAKTSGAGSVLERDTRDSEEKGRIAQAIVGRAIAYLSGGEFSPITTPNESSTIRDLILAALRNFPEGAKTSQLRVFITDAYRREIDRASFTPQLSKLKADGILDQDGPTGRWSIRGMSPDEMREQKIIPPHAIVPGEPEKVSPFELSKGDSKVTEGSEPPFKRRV